MMSLQECRAAVLAIREVCDLPVMVSLTYNEDGRTLYGTDPVTAVVVMQSLGADAVGMNCSTGPEAMLEPIAKMAEYAAIPLLAKPNAGMPELIDGQTVFNVEPEEFAEVGKKLVEEGAAIIGGCCGTTPDYIRKIAAGISLDYPVGSRETVAEVTVSSEKPAYGFMERRVKDPSHKLVAVELVPPLNADDEKLLDAAHILKNAEVDVVTFPDSPSGRTRADSVLMAEKIRLETGLCVMPHICCRDKNAIAIRSTILGASLNHITNFLLLTGDPVPVLFRQTTKSVFNFDSVGMMKIVQEMNSDTFSEHPVTYGGAINHNRMNTCLLYTSPSPRDA